MTTRSESEGAGHAGPSAAERSWAIAVHGGAGDVPPAEIPDRVAACERAVAEGARILAAGGSALDAVEAAVRVLEDDPLFNAGTGACLTEEGHIELDASIMEGASLHAGAVCALPPFKNPIAIARAVLEERRHVLYAGAGAAAFAVAHGFSPADEASMITARARARLAEVRARAIESGGTVGAVARDTAGHVAAATSTGGMAGKRPGRVGDSPIVGAGTYADDTSGACSTTGHGESMMRVCLAKTATDALRSGRSAEDAAKEALAWMEARTKGRAGLVIVGANGTIGVARTTAAMPWALSTERESRSGA